MSVRLLSRDPTTEQGPTAALAHAPSHAITVVILRAMGIVLLMSIAVIHFVQLVPTFQQIAAGAISLRRISQEP